MFLVPVPAGRRRSLAAVGLSVCLSAVALAGCGGSSSGAGQPPASESLESSPGAAATPTPAVTTPRTTVTAPARTTPAPAPAPSTRVISFRVAHPWVWPIEPAPARVTHLQKVPPVPQLVRISVGSHLNDPGEPPFNRISFTFTGGFPSYRFVFPLADELVGDPSGLPVPLAGLGLLTVTFTQAQAHTSTLPVRSSIVSQPGRPVALRRIVDYAQAGDVEGVLTYGIGVTWPIPKSNPQFAVRACEVHVVTPSGQHQYVVAIDIDADNPVAR